MEKEHLIPSAPPPPYTEVQQPYSGYQGLPLPPPPQYSYPSQPGYQSSHQATTTVVIQQPPTVTTNLIVAPESYIWFSISMCVFCWPLGLVAIILSCQSRSLTKAGNFEEAISKGKRARGFCFAALGFGTIINILVAINLATRTR